MIRTTGTVYDSTSRFVRHFPQRSTARLLLERDWKDRASCVVHREADTVSNVSSDVSSHVSSDAHWARHRVMVLEPHHLKLSSTPARLS